MSRSRSAQKIQDTIGKGAGIFDMHRMRRIVDYADARAGDRTQHLDALFRREQQVLFSADYQCIRPDSLQIFPAIETCDRGDLHFERDIALRIGILDRESDGQIQRLPVIEKST